MNVMPFPRPRRLGKVNVPTVTLAHGGGGKAMKDLIDDVFVEAFDNAALAPLEDQARFDLAGIATHGDRLAFTTDSFVVDPLIFPGGDIGKLAVCGTVNDLAVGGARPLYLSCAVIIEEGVTLDLLRQIARSMAVAAKDAGVQIVTGDTKVVHKGACDKLFITTTGIGAIREGVTLGAHLARPGDAVLVNGLLGDHGAAILGARGDMALETPIESDCAALHGLIEALLAAAPNTRTLRDATRGGLATVLNEIASRLGDRHRDRRDADPDPRGGQGFLRDLRARPALPRERGQDRRRGSGRGGGSRTRRHAGASPRGGVEHHRHGQRRRGGPRYHEDGVRRPPHRRHAGRRATAQDLLEARNARARHHPQYRRHR